MVNRETRSLFDSRKVCDYNNGSRSPVEVTNSRARVQRSGSRANVLRQTFAGSPKVMLFFFLDRFRQHHSLNTYHAHISTSLFIYFIYLFIFIFFTFHAWPAGISVPKIIVDPNARLSNPFES